MNIFNKIIVVLILLFLICFSIVATVNVWGEFFKWSDQALRILNPEHTVNKLVSTLALLAVLVLCLFLISMEFYKRRTKVANISSSKTGNAMVTLETISGQIKNEAMKVRGLEEIRVKILPRTTGIIINMNARLKENVDIPKKMQEIIDAASGIVSEKLGVKVMKTNLTITGLVPGVKEEETEEEAREGIKVEEAGEEEARKEESRQEESKEKESEVGGTGQEVKKSGETGEDSDKKEG